MTYMICYAGRIVAHCKQFTSRRAAERVMREIWPEGGTYVMDPLE
jgi:hypothetical protein